MMRSRFLPLACLTLFLCASADAQNLRSAVSLDGLDTNTCTVPSPCRTFGVAIAATAPDGEIIVLKSGGYGPFVIDRAVSVISPLGIHTAIAPTTGAAISVQAGIPDRVVVRGLYLNSQGGTTGIDFTSGKSLQVENTVISGFSGRGINVARADPFATELSVKDSIIRNGDRALAGTAGVFLQNSAIGSVKAVLDGSYLGQYNAGLTLAGNARATIRDSVVTYNEYGMTCSAAALKQSSLNVENVVVSFSNSQAVFVGDSAFYAGGTATVRLSNTLITDSGVGVRTTANGTAYLAFCTVTANSTGLSGTEGFRISLGNNRIFNNNSTSGFTSTLPQQ